MYFFTHRRSRSLCFVFLATNNGQQTNVALGGNKVVMPAHSDWNEMSRSCSNKVSAADRLPVMIGIIGPGSCRIRLSESTGPLRSMRTIRWAECTDTFDRDVCLTSRPYFSAYHDYFARAPREAVAKANAASAAACTATSRLCLRVAERHGDLGVAERAEHALQHRPAAPAGCGWPV